MGPSRPLRRRLGGPTPRSISTSTEDPGMKKTLILFLFLIMLAASPGLCRAQVSGNVAYSQGGGKARAAQNERNKRVLTQNELPPGHTSVFIEASVLMNVRADEYVAVFGVAEEGTTVGECIKKMDATVKQFSDALKPL